MEARARHCWDSAISIQHSIRFQKQPWHIQAADHVQVAHLPATELMWFSWPLQAGRLDRVFQLYNTMQSSGLQLSSRTFTGLMTACATAKHLGAAEGILRLMERVGQMPAVQTYTALINACVSQGSPDALERAFQVSLASPPPPLPPSLSPLPTPSSALQWRSLMPSQPRRHLAFLQALVSATAAVNTY